MAVPASPQTVLRHVEDNQLRSMVSFGSHTWDTLDHLDPRAQADVWGTPFFRDRFAKFMADYKSLEPDQKVELEKLERKMMSVPPSQGGIPSGKTSEELHRWAIASFKAYIRDEDNLRELTRNQGSNEELARFLAIKEIYDLVKPEQMLVRAAQDESMDIEDIKTIGLFIIAQFGGTNADAAHKATDIIAAAMTSFADEDRRQSLWFDEGQYDRNFDFTPDKHENIEAQTRLATAVVSLVFTKTNPNDLDRRLVVNLAAAAKYDPSKHLARNAIVRTLRNFLFKLASSLGFKPNFWPIQESLVNDISLRIEERQKVEQRKELEYYHRNRYLHTTKPAHRDNPAWVKRAEIRDQEVGIAAFGTVERVAPMVNPNGRPQRYKRETGAEYGTLIREALTVCRRRKQNTPEFYNTFNAMLVRKRHEANGYGPVARKYLELYPEKWRHYVYELGPHLPPYDGLETGYGYEFDHDKHHDVIDAANDGYKLRISPPYKAEMVGVPRGYDNWRRENPTTAEELEDCDIVSVVYQDMRTETRVAREVESAREDVAQYLTQQRFKVLDKPANGTVDVVDPYEAKDYERRGETREVFYGVSTDKHTDVLKLDDEMRSIDDTINEIVEASKTTGLPFKTLKIISDTLGLEYRDLTAIARSEGKLSSLALREHAEYDRDHDAYDKRGALVIKIAEIAKRAAAKHPRIDAGFLAEGKLDNALSDGYALNSLIYLAAATRFSLQELDIIVQKTGKSIPQFKREAEEMAEGVPTLPGFTDEGMRNPCTVFLLMKAAVENGIELPKEAVAAALLYGLYRLDPKGDVLPDGAFPEDQRPTRLGQKSRELVSTRVPPYPYTTVKTNVGLGTRVVRPEIVRAIVDFHVEDFDAEQVGEKQLLKTRSLKLDGAPQRPVSADDLPTLTSYSPPTTPPARPASAGGEPVGASDPFFYDFMAPVEIHPTPTPRAARNGIPKPVLTRRTVDTSYGSVAVTTEEYGSGSKGHIVTVYDVPPQPLAAASSRPPASPIAVTAPDTVPDDDTDSVLEWARTSVPTTPAGATKAPVAVSPADDVSWEDLRRWGNTTPPADSADPDTRAGASILDAEVTKTTSAAASPAPKRSLSAPSSPVARAEAGSPPAADSVSGSVGEALSAASSPAKATTATVRRSPSAASPVVYDGGSDWGSWGADSNPATPVKGNKPPVSALSFDEDDDAGWLGWGETPPRMSAAERRTALGEESPSAAFMAGIEDLSPIRPAPKQRTARGGFTGGGISPSPFSRLLYGMSPLRSPAYVESPSKRRDQDPMKLADLDAPPALTDQVVPELRVDDQVDELPPALGDIAVPELKDGPTGGIQETALDVEVPKLDDEVEEERARSAFFETLFADDEMFVRTEAGYGLRKPMDNSPYGSPAGYRSEGGTYHSTPHSDVKRHARTFHAGAGVGMPHSPGIYSPSRFDDDTCVDLTDVVRKSRDQRDVSVEVVDDDDSGVLAGVPPLREAEPDKGVLGIAVPPMTGAGDDLVVAEAPRRNDSMLSDVPDLDTSSDQIGKDVIDAVPELKAHDSRLKTAGSSTPSSSDDVLIDVPELRVDPSHPATGSAPALTSSSPRLVGRTTPPSHSTTTDAGNSGVLDFEIPDLMT